MRYENRTDSGKSLEFVCTASPSSDLSKKLVVLQTETGDKITIPLEEFQENYKLLSGKSSTSTEAIKETLNNIRQNSNVRFITLPFLITISGVMANAYKSRPWLNDPILPFYGLGIAVVGLVLEIVLSRNLNCWWQALRSEASSPPWNIILAHRSPVAVWCARIFLFLPYPALVFYWLSKIVPETIALSVAAICFAIGNVIWYLAKPAK